MISSDSIIITSKLLNASTYQNISFNSESVIINQNKFLCLDLNCNISSFDLEASKVVLYFYENRNSNTSVGIYKCSSDGITLSNSVIAQFICQLAPRAVVVGLANSFFDLPFSWATDSFFNFGKRIINQGIKKTFQEIFAL